MDDNVTMNKMEREQLFVFRLLMDGKIKQTEAAARLNLSTRWVRKKLKRYKELGDAGLVHRGRFRQSKRRWNSDQEELSIDLLKTTWQGFGPTYAAEKLKELYGIKVSGETLRKRMSRAGLWEPKQQRSKHRARRDRSPMIGMMVQLDGSPHDWFEGRAPSCTLLVFIDDATSQILWLQFVKSESVEALMRSTKNFIERHGIPGTFYTDHGSVFHVNLNNQEGEKKTQWGLACEELGIQVIHAHSPQAKGRVERCNRTLQDRLVKEMRIANISSMEAANNFVQTRGFIKNHNRAFAVSPAQNGSAFRDHQGYDLADVFTTKEVRTLANDFTIAYNKRILQLKGQQKTCLRPKDVIIIKTSLSGAISLWMRKTELVFEEIATKPKPLTQKEPPAVRILHKPNINSRRWVAGLPPLQSRVKPASPAVKAS